MRRLLESLSPDLRPFYWKLVGGMFALYVVLMLTAAGVFVSHGSSRKLAQQPVTTVASEQEPHTAAASMPVRQAGLNR
jgi:hypothetical protein